MSTNDGIPFEFGIDGLDDLIAPKNDTVLPANGVWTAAIVGPDGCGKSLLALHLASNYWQRTSTSGIRPHVLYISTDLSHDQAAQHWGTFGLDFPRWRRERLKSAYECSDALLAEKEARELHLHKYTPSCKENSDHENVSDPTSSAQDDSLEDFFAPPKETSNRVSFLDLQGETAGDDWGFINYLVGLLPSAVGKAMGEKRRDKHLLVVDAVEGLESKVGSRDAYGLRRDRRSRVAQLIRNCQAIGVHLVLIVEEPRANARLTPFQESDTITSREVERLFAISVRTARLLARKWADTRFLVIVSAAKKNRR